MPAPELPELDRSQLPPERLELLRTVDREMGPWIPRAAVPIYGLGSSGGPFLQGSGTLLQVAEARFLITAKHVAEDLGNGLKLGFGNAAGGELTRLRSAWAAPDPHDVAIFPLSDAQVARLEGMRFLRLHEIDVTAAQSDGAAGWYSIYGFPGCWFDHDAARKVVISRPFRFGVTLYQGDASVLRGVDPAVHLLFDAREVGAMLLDGGQPEFPERYGGISGCGIWRIAKPSEQNAEWTKEQARLVGVQMGVFSGPRVVKATRWGYVLEVIRQARPDLSAALALTLAGGPRLVDLPRLVWHER